MKNCLPRQLTLVILFGVLIFFGCSKKEDAEKSNFSVDGEKYYISTCNFINKGVVVGHNPVTYKYELTFKTDGITKTDTSYVGSGSFITVTFYSSDESGLITGDYTYDGFKSYDEYTITDGIIKVNYNSVTLPDNYYSGKVQTGIINVVRRGNTFDFEIELYTFETIFFPSYKVVGFYKGIITTIS